MITATYNELMNISFKAAEYINRLNGESETFQIDGETLLAVISYEAETKQDKGDYYTAPYSWIENETVTVEGVYNEDGENNTEYAEWLEKQLN